VEAAMRVIFALWMREVRKYFRSPAQMIGTLGSPVMYLGVLGFGLGPIFQRAGEGSYLQFMAPGIMSMTILFTSTFSGMALLWDRQFGFLKETLVAPVPRLTIMVGRTVGGATVALFQGLLVFGISLLAGFRPAHALVVPTAILVMALIALVFSAMGTIIGSSLKEMQGFPIIMNFLVMPIFFLSGALFPLANLPKALSFLTSLDPLSYGVDGLRSALISTSHFGSALDITVLCVVGIVFLAIGTHLFSRIEI